MKFAIFFSSSEVGTMRSREKYLDGAGAECWGGGGLRVWEGREGSLEILHIKRLRTGERLESVDFRSESPGRRCSLSFLRAPSNGLLEDKVWRLHFLLSALLQHPEESGLTPLPGPGPHLAGRWGKSLQSSC